MKSSPSNPRHRSGVEAKLCLGSWCHHEMDLGSFGSGEMQILPLASISIHISAISAIISETFSMIFHHFPRNGHPILQYSPIGPIGPSPPQGGHRGHPPMRWWVSRMHEDSVHLCGVQGESPCIPALEGGVDGESWVLRSFLIWDTVLGKILGLVDWGWFNKNNKKSNRLCGIFHAFNVEVSKVGRLAPTSVERGLPRWCRPLPMDAASGARQRMTLPRPAVFSARGKLNGFTLGCQHGGLEQRLASRAAKSYGMPWIGNVFRLLLSMGLGRKGMLRINPWWIKNP